jgi:uncharacterized protein with LGFP repeats
LGAPVGDEYALGSARGQNYLHGRIYSAAATGVHELHGAIFGRWAALQGPGGVLGLPTTDERTTPDGRGRYNHFVGGSVYWSSSTGAHAVGGAIRSRWAALGWERSRLGYPTSDEYAVSGGRRSDFAHGSLIWSARSGVVTVVYR